ncbi:unnamed protein product [Owenia fusiformis]|uniref:Eukaryotic translation initiation factor 3 subunit H n=1 Tax=Owenia fusiformis TaxID=6347 RepID=A0A8J1TQB8_OWEFU|nr:unnamed protein product [Owenia fusiformis]
MAGRNSDSQVKFVLIDGLVVLKVIKHCEEIGSGGTELVQGVLLGLVVENRLEITNCFPFPQHSENQEDFDEVQYQMEMMRNLRHVNIDHLHVGWYQSTYHGSFVNKALIESQFNYQHSIEESVVLIYDPVKSSHGKISLKAFRLTPVMMEMYREGDFSPETVSSSNLSFEKMFEEIPIVFKNSHLVNALMCEIEETQPPKEHDQFLDLATTSVLEKEMALMMKCVDELSQDANKFTNFQRQVQKQKHAKEQYLMKRKQENELRAQRKEAPLPEEDINKIFKPLQPPPRLESLLTSAQINQYSQSINEFAKQSFGKLFMAESLQENKVASN